MRSKVTRPLLQPRKMISVFFNVVLFLSPSFSLHIRPFVARSHHCAFSQKRFQVAALFLFSFSLDVCLHSAHNWVLEVWRNRNALAPISRCARVLPHHARMLRLFPTRTLDGDNRTQIRRKKCSAAAGRRCGETLPSLGRFIRRTDSDREREIGLGDCSNAPVLCDHDRERTHRHTKGGARYRPSSLTFVFSFFVF